MEVESKEPDNVSVSSLESFFVIIENHQKKFFTLVITAILALLLRINIS